MISLLRSRRVILVGGPGGVGKTTVAAALGIQSAKEGYRTLVLTVDPARRLAQALGFNDFSSELQKVSAEGIDGDKLYASMLDTQRYFDRIIDKFAKEPAQKEKILKNPIYRIMVESLGGTHEYAAMERLLEFASDDRFEKIIVDTPPTQNAVDLLSAPQRLADFMDNSVIRWFQGSSPRYLSFFRQGTKLAMKLMQKIFGAEFLASFAELMDDLEGMQAGFKNRNLEIIRLLQSSATAFLLVTYPSEARFAESESFTKTLEEKRIHLHGLILNRVEPAVPSTSQGYAAGVNEMLAYYGSLRRQQEIWIERFSTLLPDALKLTIPKQTQPVHDVAALSQLGAYLVK